MKYTFVIFSFLYILLYSCSSPEKGGEYTIVFGSCNRTELEQPLWKPILSNAPDLFIWLGDIVYGDTHDMNRLAAQYHSQNSKEDYLLLKSKTSIIGIWDDHDYGWNDAGKGYSKKDSSKILLGQFLGIREDSDVWRREGMYSSSTVGDENIKIKILLLDARWFRDTLESSSVPGRRYEASEEGDILGEVQWKWLEKELTNSTADAHLIGCGIQMVAEEHGWEKWANLPKSRARLFELLARTSPKAPLLISGDRHIAELSADTLSNGQVIYDLTSSGLTHTWSTVREEANRHRIGEMVVALNFGVLQYKKLQDRLDITLQIRGEKDSLYLEQILHY